MFLVGLESDIGFDAFDIAMGLMAGGQCCLVCVQGRLGFLYQSTNIGIVQSPHLSMRLTPDID
jgi:hypothetical protein